MEEIRFGLTMPAHLSPTTWLTLEFCSPHDTRQIVIDLSMPNVTIAPKALWLRAFTITHLYRSLMRCQRWVRIACVKSRCRQQLAVALGQGRPACSGRVSMIFRPVRTVEDLLIAILCQYFDGGYVSRLPPDWIRWLKELRAKGKKNPWWPAAFIRGWGGEDLESMRDGTIACWNLLVKKWMDTIK